MANPFTSQKKVACITAIADRKDITPNAKLTLLALVATADDTGTSKISEDEIVKVTTAIKSIVMDDALASLDLGDDLDDENRHG